MLEEFLFCHLNTSFIICGTLGRLWVSINHGPSGFPAGFELGQLPAQRAERRQQAPVAQQVWG